jgi:hypothetical protein
VAEHAIALALPPERALSVLRRTAEDWGAELQADGENGGRLHLPVVAGIRRGVVAGPVEVRPAEGGSRVVFRPEESIYSVQVAAVTILVLATAGALLTVLWPFYPQLIGVAPFGALIALGGWFLVVSRLRSSGPDEFLDAVAANGAMADAAPEDPEEEGESS